MIYDRFNATPRLIPFLNPCNPVRKHATSVLWPISVGRSRHSSRTLPPILQGGGACGSGGCSAFRRGRPVFPAPGLAASMRVVLPCSPVARPRRVQQGDPRPPSPRLGEGTQGDSRRPRGYQRCSLWSEEGIVVHHRSALLSAPLDTCLGAPPHRPTGDKGAEWVPPAVLVL